MTGDLRVQQHATARNQALHLAHLYARHLDHAIAQALDNGGDGDHNLVLAHALTRDLAYALGSALGRTPVSLALDPARNLDLACAHADAGNVIHALARAHRRARRRVRAHGRRGHPFPARDVALRLDAAHVIANSLTKNLDHARATAGPSEAGTRIPVRRRTLAGIAVAIVDRMVRILPVEHRTRYRQEFLAELYVLAGERAPRRTQLGHALRATAGMWSLRRALRAPRPGREQAR